MTQEQNAPAFFIKKANILDFFQNRGTMGTYSGKEWAYEQDLYT